MKRRIPGLYLVWAFWSCLISGWLILAMQQREELRLLETEEARAFPGTDWVTWENRDGAIEATGVHPLPRYKPFPPQQIRKGDRLRKINYEEVLSAEVVERYLEASPQGKTFVFQITPAEAASDSALTVRRVRAGFELPYMATRHGGWWRVEVWLSGLLLVVSLLVALILFPVVKNQVRQYGFLLAVVGIGLLIGGVQSAHGLYLVLESDLVATGFARFCMQALTFLVPLYGIAYVFATKAMAFWLKLPALVLGGIIWFWALNWSWGPIHTTEMRWLVNQTVSGFGLLLAGGIGLAQIQPKTNGFVLVRLGGAALLALGAMGLQFFPAQWTEPAVLVLHGILFFPLLDAAQNELRFGKVSLVVTRALQAVAFLAFSMLGYVLISSIFNAVLPESPYRTVLEVLVLLLALLGGRWIYRTNQRRLSAYFTTTQQNRLDSFRAFLASIPRFTSTAALKAEVVAKTSEYFGANVQWWQPQAAKDWEKRLRTLLAEKRTFWASSPELGGLRVKEDLAEKLTTWSYVLAVPLSAEDPDSEMLLLGRKNKGVYNLADMDLVFQLARQSYLTMNVLDLLARERELLRRNYEANLTVLRAQINPHFLFNTLNTISALIHDAPDLAEEAVEHLAFIFRYTLDHAGDRFVTLKQELSLVEAYLEVEKIRFGDRLMVSVDVEKEARETQIPALVLQTLIENCIKHGIAKIIGKGVVSIDAYMENGVTVVEVYDNGPGIDVNRIDKGTGLNNVLTRLSHIYQNENSLYFENTGNGTRAILRIPEEPPQDSIKTPPNE